MLKEIKPRNARAARAVAAREPQHTENPKRPLFLRSTSSSALLNTLTQNLYALKRPDAVRFAKKNAVHPFEDASSLEFFARKNDTSLLVFASHSKKRPHCITIARTFDARLLDMLECCVDPATARALDQFGGRKWRVGAKPMMCFSGPQFETTGDAAAGTGGSKFALAKSLFLDLFRGAETSEMDVEGLDALLSFAAVERGEGAARSGWVLMRAWRVVTKRAGGGSKMPRVELEEVGPRIDFRLGRMQEADPNMWKEAMKREKVAKPKAKKNVDVDPIGDKIGRLHVGKQDLRELQTRKMKGLKRTFGEDGMAEAQPDAVDNEDGVDARSKKRKFVPAQG